MVNTKKSQSKRKATQNIQVLSELNQRNWAVINNGKVCFVNATYSEAVDLSSDGDSTVVTGDVATRLGITADTIFVSDN